ncbi:hypothetical protein AAKU55_000682 [Oxalobacteraceae bacterium GrIS 1.11]
MQAIDKVSNLAQQQVTEVPHEGHDVMRMAPVNDGEFREMVARHMAEDKAAPKVANGNSLGERIMTRASGLSEEIKKDQQYISKTLEQATRTGDSMQLMKGMMALSDYQTRIQFISKAVSKATSALDQLTKLQ